eukprot:c3951_g1_i1.p1 GENE.c3951_g1_i1~~c3951_g1_i1.p1  ORF type:complete len:218 (+),score=67.26 c3951_g1_i1:93-656(+)
MWSVREVEGAPKNLLVLCTVQLTVAFIGLLVASSFPDCEFQISEEGFVYIDCIKCQNRLLPTSWHSIVLFIFAFVVVCIGVTAAIKRSKSLCFLYGRLMLFYALAMGVTSIFGQLGFAELESAVLTVRSEEECFKTAVKLMTTTQFLMLIHGIEAISDLVGAVFAIQSKELFEYEAISQLSNDYEVL